MFAGLRQDAFGLELETALGELQEHERGNRVQALLQHGSVVVIEREFLRRLIHDRDGRSLPARHAGEEIGAHLAQETAALERHAHIHLRNHAVFVEFGALGRAVGGLGFVLAKRAVPDRIGGIDGAHRQVLHREEDAARPGELAHGPMEHHLRAAVERIERSARLQVGDVGHVRRHRVPGLAHVDQQVAEDQVVPEQAHVGVPQPERGQRAAHAVEVRLDIAFHLEFADPVTVDIQPQTGGQGQHPEGRDLVLVHPVHHLAVLGHVEIQVLGTGAHLVGVEHHVVTDEAVQLHLGRGLFLGGAHDARTQCRKGCQQR